MWAKCYVLQTDPIIDGNFKKCLKIQVGDINWILLVMKSDPYVNYENQRTLKWNGIMGVQIMGVQTCVKDMASFLSVDFIINTLNTLLTMWKDPCLITFPSVLSNIFLFVLCYSIDLYEFVMFVLLF